MEEQIKTRFSDQELSEFAELIERKLNAAREQLNYTLEEIKNSGTNEDAKVKGLDDGVSTSEVERMTTLANRLQKHIEHLQKAKIRVENKVYGVCRETGKLISKARLRAVPHATLSIEAKQSRVR